MEPVHIPRIILLPNPGESNPVNPITSSIHSSLPSGPRHLDGSDDADARRCQGFGRGQPCAADVIHEA